MEANEILTDVVKEFLKATDHDCDKAEKAVESFIGFFEFVEEHDALKDEMYSFFQKMLDDYVFFKFYDTPIPALITNDKYMEEFKQTTLEKARTFFNFGGFKGIK